MARRVALIVLLSALTSTAASAETIEVSWRAPEACLTQSDFRARIASLLGRSLHEDFENGLSAVVTATATADGWAATVTTDRGAERVLEGATCDEVFEAAALVLAIAIDPAAISWSSPEDPPPEPPPPPSLPAPTPRTSTVSSSPPRSPTDELRAPDIPFGVPLPRLDFRGAVRGGAGVLPGAGPGLSFGGAVLWLPLRFQAAGTVWLDRTVDQAVVGLWTFEGEACFAGVLSEHFELPVCFGTEVGRFAADSVDQITPPIRELWAGSTGAIGFAVVPIRHLAILLEVEGVVSWVVPKYEGESGVLAEIGRFGGRAGLWVELRVP